MAKILVSQITFPPPNFGYSTISKEKIVLRWLLDWIDTCLKTGELHFGDFLPDKFKLAKYLNVSAGTLQNAIRQAESMGYFESRQSVGTLIKNPNDSHKIYEKAFSKKDKAISLIKKIIIDSNLKIGEKLPSVKVLVQRIGLGENTIRIALEELVSNNTLSVCLLKRNKCCWIYNLPISNDNLKFQDMDLVSAVAKKIKDYIVNNCQIGDKIPSNSIFAKMFNVSIRTVNEATKTLNEQKIILSRRGRYGTIYLNSPQKIKKQKEREEKSLFMSRSKGEVLQENYLYSWEKTLDALKKYIIQNHESGDKIPSMRELANILNVSTNTIKHAISIMCEDGYLIAQRGKYGGVFILEMPQKDTETFTWLALNPDVVKIKQK